MNVIIDFDRESTVISYYISSINQVNWFSSIFVFIMPRVLGLCGICEFNVYDNMKTLNGIQCHSKCYIKSLREQQSQNGRSLSLHNNNSLSEQSHSSSSSENNHLEAPACKKVKLSFKKYPKTTSRYAPICVLIFLSKMGSLRLHFFSYFYEIFSNNSRFLWWGS